MSHTGIQSRAQCWLLFGSCSPSRSWVCLILPWLVETTSQHQLRRLVNHNAHRGVIQIGCSYIWRMDQKGNHFFILFYIFNLILLIFLYSRSLLVINFIHITVYMSIPISQFITPPPHTPPPLPQLGVHTFVLYICVSISALQTGSSVPFF